MADFLLLHGMCDGSWEWARVISALQADPRAGKVVAPDFPGRDANRPGEYGTVRLSDYLQTALSALRDNDLRDVILVGHSSGGACLQAIAAAEPERVRRLVCLSGAIPLPGRSLLDQQPWPLRVLTRFGLWVFGSRKRGIVPFKPFARRTLCHDLRPEDCNAILSGFVPEPPALIIDKLDWPRERVKAPATYILTTNDRVIRPKDQLRMARRLPNAEIVRFPTGHAYPVVYPDRLVELLLSYA